MATIFFTESGLIEAVALESNTSISARPYAMNYLSSVFDAVAQRREKTELRGLILHDDDNARPDRAWMMVEYLVGNRIESYQNPHTRQS